MLDLAFKNLSTFNEHKAILQRAMSKLNADTDISAVLLGGSIAVGAPDFFSDIDLYLIVKDNDFEKVFAKRNEIAQAVGKVIFSFLADHNPGGDHDHVVLYDSLIHVDFMYWRHSDLTPDQKWAKMLLLKDIDGQFSKLLFDSLACQQSQPPIDSIAIINQKFWTWCWYTFGKILRGELWEALADIHLIRSWAILPMFNWWKNIKDEGYRRLEAKLDNDLADLFKATIPIYSAESLYLVLQNEIKLFRYLRDKVFSHYKLSLDTKPENILIAGMEEKWKVFKNDTIA